MQIHTNTMKIRYGWSGIRNFNHINASNFKRKRCGWYFVRNFDPINGLKLKKKKRYCLSGVRDYHFVIS